MSNVRLSFGLFFLAFIVCGTLAPVEVLGAATGLFPTTLHVQKVGHFLGFAGLACCFSFTPERRVGWGVLLFALVLAVATELAQHVVKGRVPARLDVAIDMAGAVLGQVIAARRLRTAQQRQGDLRLRF
jgi:VanZ family protein